MRARTDGGPAWSHCGAQRRSAAHNVSIRAVMTPTPLSRHDGLALRILRKSTGLSQVRLAEIACVGCHTVSRWEGKPIFHRRSRALKSILAVLESLRRNRAGLTRARGHGVLEGQRTALKVRQPANALPSNRSGASTAPSLRVVCRATTRKGAPCKLKSVPGRRRCKYHGGKSTGPKTKEGRARIAAAQRLRWALWRAENDRSLR